MSGGHFDYKNYVMRDIAEEICRIIKNNRVVNEYGTCYDFNADTIAKFEWVADKLKLLDTLTHRIDWLVSGDDGEEQFAKHWRADGGPIVHSKNSDDLYDSNFIALNPRFQTVGRQIQNPTMSS